MLPEYTEFAEMQLGDVILTNKTMTSLIDVRPTCGCSFFLSFPRSGKVKLSHIGKTAETQPTVYTKTVQMKSILLTLSLV